MQCKYKWNNHERATICPSRQHEPWWGSEHIKINYVQIARCRVLWSPSPFSCRSEGLWECRWLSAFSCRPSRNYPWQQTAILPKVMSSSWVILYPMTVLCRTQRLRLFASSHENSEGASQYQSSSWGQLRLSWNHDVVQLLPITSFFSSGVVNPKIVL